jgi:aryl-alcohol dehydrogenase-like predicted oxidoreductase
MKKRILGRTKHRSTLITLGGAIFIYPTSEKEGDKFVKFALDQGINHIDVAPTYGDAEVKLGKWIREYRDSIFLACKTTKRTKIGASKELKESLKRLQTDHFDLYQLHGLDESEENKIVFGENGALKAIQEAKEEGLLNNIGITSHNPENILKAFDNFDFDTVLLPVNYVLHAHPEPRNNYLPVLEKAKEKKIGVIAMKSVAKGPYPTEEKTHNTWYQPFQTREEIEEAVRFTLSQAVTTATSSSDLQIAKIMIESAENFSPLEKQEQEELLTKAQNYKPLFPGN